MSTEDTNKQVVIENDEITLKELILTIFGYVKELWQRKWIIIGIALVFGGIFFVRSYLKPIVFSAETTYMLNQEEGGGGGGAISSLLGSFGLGVSGGAGSGFNTDRLMKLTTSRQIIAGALMDSVTIAKQPDLIANHIIRLYDYHEKWDDPEEPQYKFFFTNNNLEEFNRLENNIMNGLHNHVIGASKAYPGIVATNYDELSMIIRINVSSLSEKLSLALIESIYERLETYYVSRATERQTNTLKQVLNKTDSLEQLLYRLDEQLAREQDRNNSVFGNLSSVKIEQLSRTRTIAAFAYGEAIKQLEVARFQVDNSTPVFQIIDNAIPPLGRTKKSYPKDILIGCFLGGFLASLVIVIRRIFLRVME